MSFTARFGLSSVTIQDAHLTQSNVSALEALSGEIRGDVIRQWDTDYDHARTLFNGAFDRRPEAIVRPRSADDIAAALRGARASGLPVAVRGGGHHIAAFGSVDDGLSIDLSLLREVSVDPDRRIARVEGGALWSDVDRATQPYGLATAAATIASVGVAGFTLGGGIGRLARAHGLAADNLVSVELVTAAGRHVTASAEENPSLFWALRGGGGNFGVVTAFEFALHDIGPEVWAGPLVYRIDDAPRVLRAMRDLIASAPDELNVSATIVRSEGHPWLVLNPLWIGEPASADSAVQPLREVATPVNDLYGPSSYLALQSVDAPGGRRSWETSAYLGQLSDATLDALVAHAADVTLEAPRIGLLPLNGAVGRVPRSGTAFGGRGAGWLVSAGGTWDVESEDMRSRAWIEKLHGAVAADATGVGYANMMGDGRPVYPAWTHARLRAVKAQWDPANVFRSNHNVLPLGSQ
jgi:FAD/FMN-containing dehydrogenase